jgi:beta-N-acetylhexosaminidase
MASSTELSSAVGKLIVGRVDGPQLDDLSANLLKTGTMGGVTLFKDNARDIQQLINLCDAITAAGESQCLLTVDQEGGAVQRFDHVISPIPSAMALGALHNPEMVRTAIEISGEQLRLLGIQCVLAPVLDLATNKQNPIISTRAFSDDPEVVCELALLVAQTYKKFGVLPIGKHFPGHGDTLEDSHSALAVAKADLETLKNRDLVPFVRCARHMPGMLTGHLWVQALEKEPVPASLSTKITGDLLRGEMRYDGLVMTDDLPVMRAIVDHYGLEDASVKAILAGNDLLLVSGTHDQIKAVHGALLKAVQDGVITEARLQESLGRRAFFMDYFRGRFDLHKKDRDARIDRLRQSVEFGKMFLAEYSARAMCLIRGELPDWDADVGQWIVLYPDHPRYHFNLQPHFDNFLGMTAQHIPYSLNPDEKEIAGLAEKCAGKDCILLTFRAMINKGQLELGHTVGKKAKYRMVVATEAPFELSELSDWENALAALDPSDHAMEALSLVLARKVRPSGTVPVSI